MTEEEAKKKWCPFVRDAEDASNIGQSNRAPHWSTCIGSQCMAWRWNETAQFVSRSDLEFQRSGGLLEPTDGYCGLAGIEQR